MRLRAGLDEHMFAAGFDIVAAGARAGAGFWCDAKVVLAQTPADGAQRGAQHVLAFVAQAE